MLDPGTLAFLWLALGLAAVVTTVVIVVLIDRLEFGRGPERRPRATCPRCREEAAPLDRRVLRAKN